VLNVPVESVCVILVRGSGCYGLNGADAVSFDAAILSQAVGRPVRLQFSRQDEMMWENLGAACVVEHGAALASDGSVAAWDRENRVASLGNRPAMTAPETSDSGPERYVTSGMLAGYEPDPFKPLYQIPMRSLPLRCSPGT
jgi:nicotinate dehydrogenase subunit B